MRPTVYLEGGGDTASQQKAYRIGFAKMIDNKASVIACGGNARTHEKFIEHQPAKDETVLLLVDSELPVAESDTALGHLRRKTEWSWPSWVREEQVHLMATTIETWISCDPEGLARYFGSTFNASKLVVTVPIESAEKETVLAKLKAATEGGKTAAIRSLRNMLLNFLHFLSPRKLPIRHPDLVDHSSLRSARSRHRKRLACVCDLDFDGLGCTLGSIC
jgi:hypothetical protein